MISINQKCQAFDPIMILPEKTEHILDDHMKASTSCVAPAFVYLEGSRGKRFLCDYHYTYEKNITITRTPKLWNDIAFKLFDDRNKIADTFEKNINSIETLEKLCWCKEQAYVKVSTKHEYPHVIFFCNFHFRKSYYRYYSNNVIFEDQFNIIDERSRMKQTVIEECENKKTI